MQPTNNSDSELLQQYGTVNKNLTIGYYLTRPFSLAVLTVLVICLSVLSSRWSRCFTPQSSRVLAVLQVQQAVATRCTPKGRLLLVPYAKWIGQIDTTTCPNDFVNAWEKYVSDVQALSAIEHVEKGKAIIAIGAAVITGDPVSLLNSIPKPPKKVEIARITAAADWRKVERIALRYGITTTRPDTASIMMPSRA